MTKRTILIVDDEPNNILLLKGLLEQMGHQVISAENAIIGLKKLNRSIDLVVSDVMMPEMDGFEFVEKIRENHETYDIPVLVVTTLNDKADRLRAVEVGANDFIAKPVDPIELKIRTKSLLKQKAQQDEIKEFQKDLQSMVEATTTELRKALTELDKAHGEAIIHLSAAAEYRDDDTASHIQRMSGYCELIAKKKGFDIDQTALIKTCSPMHDVGKIGIPDHILLKPDKLNADEWETMKTHTTMGGEILGTSNSDYMNTGALIALSHHERWDGTGYPSGLKGYDIPIEGRICAVADVFDALTSPRPYKEAFTVEKAISIMEQGRGSHFDPEIIDIFLANLEELLEIKRQYGDDK